RTEAWQAYHGAAHTSGPDVGRLATDAGVGRLVLYHQLMFTGSRAAIETQVRSTWKGDLVWGEDLTVITWPEAEPAATTASPPLDADARLVDSRGADRSPPRPPEP
ncbi:MAG TPA: hypothetical protein VLA56_08780, partial [Pseudomonadales bacterium]|nr:hypothetical protein [Pseudomonadales bacterium]